MNLVILEIRVVNGDLTIFREVDDGSFAITAALRDVKLVYSDVHLSDSVYQNSLCLRTHRLRAAPCEIYIAAVQLDDSTPASVDLQII